MSKHSVLAWSMVVALGGFLFGFDTAVISGAEKSIQQYWGLSVFAHGLTISIALIGTEGPDTPPFRTIVPCGPKQLYR